MQVRPAMEEWLYGTMKYAFAVFQSNSAIVNRHSACADIDYFTCHFICNGGLLSPLAFLAEGERQTLCLGSQPAFHGIQPSVICEHSQKHQYCNTLMTARGQCCIYWLVGSCFPGSYFIIVLQLTAGSWNCLDS